MTVSTECAGDVGLQDDSTAGAWAHLGLETLSGDLHRPNQSNATAQAHGPGPPNGRATPEHDGGACGFIGRLSRTLLGF